MEVVWNGTMERASIERERRPAPKGRDPQMHQDVTDLVFLCLMHEGEQSIAAISLVTGLEAHTVCDALVSLRRRGVVVITDRTVGNRYGRPSRLYRCV